MLLPCASCRRHVDVREVACPFCGAARIASRPASLVAQLGRASRAAVFAGAAACWTNNPPPQYASPPPPPPPDGEQQQSQAPPVPSRAVDTSQDGTPPDPGLAPKPRADRGTILGRVVNASSVRYPGVEVTIVGPTFSAKPVKVVTDSRGIFLLENVVPGNYRITIESARLTPQDPPISTSLAITAGNVQTLAILGEATAPVAAPVPVDHSCCKPYGAPPARRRVV
jgi:hypothetical protein